MSRIPANNPQWKSAASGIVAQKIAKAWKSVAREVHYFGVIGGKAKIAAAEERLKAELLKLGYQISKPYSISSVTGILSSIADHLFEYDEDEQIAKAIDHQLKYSVKVVNIEGELHKLGERLCRLAETFVASNSPVTNPQATAIVDLDDANVRIEISDFTHQMDDSFFVAFERVLEGEVQNFAAQQDLDPRGMSSDLYEDTLSYSFSFSDW